MTIEQLNWFLDLFEETGVTVWLDGGWAVDALLGKQTRPHADIDIMIPMPDSERLVAALKDQRFEDVHTDDWCPENFVMGHPERGQIDFHVFVLAEDGSGVYKPGDIDWKMTSEELAGSGTIGGRPVRCLSAEYQVRSHSGYSLKATDLHDVTQLRDRFRLELLPEQISAIQQSR